MGRLHFWEIRRGDFRACLDVNGLGLLPVGNVRKLVKIAQQADDLDCLAHLAQMIPAAIQEEEQRLEDMRAKPMGALLYEAYPMHKLPTGQKERKKLTADLIRRQVRNISNLKKISTMKEITDYE